jgi:hypothetical protein
MDLQAHTWVLCLNWGGLVLDKQDRMAFSHLTAKLPRVRHPTTGFRVPENTFNGHVLQ